MEVSVKKQVSISVKELVGAMTVIEIAEFCSQVAIRLDGDFADRNEAASKFADGLSEMGCRFIAEVVTHHYWRTAQKEGSRDD